MNESLVTLYCREIVARHGVWEKRYIPLPASAFREKPQGHWPESDPLLCEPDLDPNLLRRRWLVGQIIPDIETFADVTAIAAQLPSFVLLGPCGSGKSIVLTRLALTQAEALLRDDGADRLPILVPLNRYHALTKPERFLAQYLQSQGAIGFPAHAQLAPTLHERLDSGQVLLLLDGLDELPRKFRHWALKRWQKFVRRYGQSGRGNRIVISAKTPYSVYALGLPIVSLLPLAAPEQQHLLCDLLGEEDGAISWEALHQPELPNLLNLIGNPYWLTLTADIIRLGGGPAGSRNQLLATWVNHVSTCTSAPGAEDEEESAPRLSAEVLQAFGDATFKLYRKAGDGAVIRRSQWAQALSKQIPNESVAYLLGDESPFLEKEQLLVAERHAPDPLLWFKHNWLQAYFSAEALQRRFDNGKERMSDWKFAPPDSGLRDNRLLRGNAFAPLPEQVVLAHEEEALLIAGRVPTSTDGLSALLKVNPILAARCALERGEFLEPELRQHLVEALIELLSDGRAPLPTRIAAGNLLGRLGDPRLAEVVSIPKGSVVLGMARTRHEVELPAFNLFKYPVTRQEFARFAASDAYDEREWWTRAGWKWRQGTHLPRRSEPDIIQGRPNHPISGVSWYEAIAYANWLSSHTGTLYRLPTEAEWERAAKGPTEHRFPWGDDPDAARANTCTFDSLYAFSTTPVGIYPDGAGRYGAYDQAGNVWEWCTSRYLPYPYDAHDGREILQNDDARVLKGGSWLQPLDKAKCHVRGTELPDVARPDIGFRLIEVVGQNLTE